MSQAVAADKGASKALAAFIVGSDWNQIPPKVRHQAKRSLLNFFAVALAGSRDRAVEIALGMLSKFAGKGEATIIGHADRADAMTAAFLNAFSANVHDFDDTHIRTVIHPTAPVAPPLLALCEQQKLSGRDFLHALILGMEVECRIGNAVSPGHYRRGWHITATCGVFGAAAAAGKALGLNPQELIWALGNASAQSSGLVEPLGFMAKSLGVGNSARNGLLSALLAQQGFDGPERPLEGRYGFLNVMSDGVDMTQITDALGGRWDMLDNIHKPYPCGIVLNSVVDGCLQLARVMDAPAQELKSITLYGHPLLRQRANRPNVETGREAQVSAQHAAAVCLIHGKAGLEQFSDAAAKDSHVREWRHKVSIVDAPDIAVEGIRLVAERHDGTTQTVIVEHALGTNARPLSDADLEEKCRTLADGGALDCSQTDRLIDLIWSMDEIENASALLQLARPADG